MHERLTSRLDTLYTDAGDRLRAQSLAAILLALALGTVGGIPFVVALASRAWRVPVAVLGAAGMYYMTRTGNAGQVSGLELQFRSILENTFGVRPRTKEFLLGHPLFFVGIFLALRYRWAMVLLIAGTIAQLSMVDTFAHIHTPFLLSLIRIFLGLGIGVLIALAIIAVWQIAEKVWARWAVRSGIVRSE